MGHSLLTNWVQAFVSYNKRTNFFFFLITITYFVLAVPIAVTIKNHLLGNEIQKVERVGLNNVALIRSNIEASIFMDTFLADSLATLITIDPDMAFQKWDVIAQQLLNKAQNVRNVAASPNNVIRYIYPLEGNEKALGMDLSLIPSQNKAIQIAKQLQHVYVDGPVELIQGGQALIARYPIYSDYPYNQAYWGTVSVVIDFDKLLERSGLYELKGTKVAIKSVTHTPTLIYGSLDTFDSPSTQQIINLPYGKWQIAAKFNMDESSHIQFIKRIVTTILVIAILLIYALIFLLYRNYKTIHMAAMHDELTHLPNRRYINQLLTNITKGKDRTPTFTLLSIDVNDFKRVNDSYGHDVGDKFLKFIAAKLKENVRHNDTVARMGGDEFILILMHVHDVEQVKKIISSIKKKIESDAFYHKDQQIFPSISIGHAICEQGSCSVDSLITKADHAMYLNKNAYAFSNTDFTNKE